MEDKEGLIAIGDISLDNSIKLEIENEQKLIAKKKRIRILILITILIIIGLIIYLVLKKNTQTDETDDDKDDFELQNTYLKSFNLDFIAGQKGNISLEMRTKKNLTKNFSEKFNISIESCDKKDKTFKFTEEKEKSISLYNIVITSNKANTYPKYDECPITIKINDKEINHIHPLLKIFPDKIDTSEIISDYLKDPNSTDILKDGEIETNYYFEIKSLDVFGNLCPTDQQIIGIKVLFNEEINILSEDIQETGYKKYSLLPTEVGNYTITSKMNSDKERNYLENKLIFFINFGDFEKIEWDLNNKTENITGFNIECYGKNNYHIKASYFINRFQASCSTDQDLIINIENKIDSENEYKALYNFDISIISQKTLNCSIFDIVNKTSIEKTWIINES